MALADNLEFLNLNSLRAYPLKEGTTRKSTDTFFLIPDSFISDASFAVDSVITTKLYITKLVNNNDNISIEIAKDVAGSPVSIGNFSVNVIDHTRYKEYYLMPNSSYPLANGKLCINDLTDIKGLPSGTFTFNLAATEFETRTIIPSVSNISKFKFLNDDGTEVVSLSGTVIIQARTNLKFSKEEVIINGVNVTRIVLDAGSGIGLNKDCPNDLPCIKTINGIPPTNVGNFTIEGKDCSGITTAAAVLTLNETCCKPCVGCDEVGTLTERLISIESDLLKLKDYYIQLNLLSQQLHGLVGFSCDCPAP